MKTSAMLGRVEAIGSIDHWISGALSMVAGRSSALDWLLLQALQTDLLKVFPLIAVLLASCWNWGRRERSIAGLLGASLALAGAALAQHFGGDRVRPALSGLYHFPALPAEVQTDVVSFPSETTAVAFALAAALTGCGRGPAGFAWIWSVVMVCLPRLYGGYHYASDLFAGAVIGLLSWHLILRAGLARRLADAFDRLGPKSLAVPQILLIFYAFELARLFADIRTIAGR